MKRRKTNRNKAVWGAVIGAAASLLGGLASNLIGSNAQEKARKRQEAAEYEARNNATAANLANAINGSQDIVDDYYDRVTLKRYGGRNKAEGGGGFDWNSVINGISGAMGSIGNAVIKSNGYNGVQIIQPTPMQFQPKVRKYPTMYDRLMQQNFRCGGRKKARCGKKI